MIRVLEKLIGERRCLANIRCDNGPEFISNKLAEWCADISRKISLQFIQPGRPMQNAYIERKNGSLRRELLDAYLFYSLAEVRAMSEAWRIDYNTERPHKSLGLYVAINLFTKATSSFIHTSKGKLYIHLSAAVVVDKAVNNEKKMIFNNSN